MAARVAVCGVRRTVVQPAPRGAFAVHEFIYEWAAERALVYYTGRHATIYLAGDLWNRPCPPVPDVDAVIDFDELLAGGRPMIGSPRAIARDVTVVVPTMGGPFLQGCLESIARRNRLAGPSRRHRPERRLTARRPGRRRCGKRGMDVSHILAKQAGISAATNRGLEQVRTPFAAITHDDCRVRSDWLERLAAASPKSATQL